MPTPIPTTYKLYLDPLLGFTPGGTTWQDQSLYEQVYTFDNTGYTYENTIGSFLLPTTTEANQDPPLPGEIPVGTGAITIIAWVKVTQTIGNADDFYVFTVGRNKRSGIDESRLIGLKVRAVDNGPGGSVVLTPGTVHDRGYRYSSFTAGANTTYFQYDEWKMISYTKPSNGTISQGKLYVDGIELTSYSTGFGSDLINTSVNNTPTGLYPRIEINSTTVASSFYSNTPGTVGEVWVYGEVLTQADLFNFYEVTQPRYFPVAPSDFSDGRSFGQGFNG